MTFYPTCELLVWVSQLVQTARVRDVTEIRISLSCASLVFFVDTSTAGLLLGTLCFPNHQQLTLHIAFSTSRPSQPTTPNSEKDNVVVGCVRELVQ